MATLTARTGQLVYPLVIEHVLKHGVTRSPRGFVTLDAGFTVIELESACRALPLDTGRDLSLNIAAAEAVQLIGGFSRPDLLLKAGPQFAQYMNGDGFHGAYGARIKYQTAQAVDKLRQDPLTRQAVITLWNAHLDNIEGMKDYPCTVALQFQVEDDDQLCMNAFMRSSDVWLGLPYDMFQFTQLQFSVAHALGLRTGWFRLTTLSLHLYSVNIISAEQKIHHATDGVLQPKGIGRPGDSFSAIMKRARVLTTEAVNEGETSSEQWYRSRFASYLG